MLVEATPLDGVYLFTPKVFGDERGFFLESWNA
jgi:dTDP-4-dehydrorhamnose 3,5-epimerase